MSYAIFFAHHGVIVSDMRIDALQNLASAINTLIMSF